MIPVSAMMDGASINDAILGAHAPLLPETDPRHVPNGGRQERRSSLTVVPVIVSAVLLLVLAAVMVFALQHVDGQGGAVVPASGDVVIVADGGRVVEMAASRGVVEGVSEKSTGPLLGGALRDYGWTNAMLSWQRTAFHFQPPEKRTFMVLHDTG